MLIATDYTILRNVKSGSVTFDAPREPVRVATLLNEDAFTGMGKGLGGWMRHGRSVFFEDRMHDWHWRDGKFFFHPGGTNREQDVVLVFAEQEVLYCSQCGKIAHEGPCQV